MPTHSTASVASSACGGEEPSCSVASSSVHNGQAQTPENTLTISLALSLPAKRSLWSWAWATQGATKSTSSHSPLWEQGGTTAGIDRRLRNQRRLYYIIIDVAGKCHRQSTAYYLLCCIVSLVCVGPLCFASCVPIACLFIPCAFSFHISPVNPTWKNQF